MMKITGLSHLFKWENLHNWWLTKYFFAPLYTSSVMSSWRSGRGLQWQHVKLWWTPCTRGLRQCWKIMVATQNIDTLGPIWTFSLRGVLTFVASGLDINGCVQLFWGDSKFTLLYKLYTHYFTLYQSVISSVLSHEWKYIIKYLQKHGSIFTSVHLCLIQIATI